MYIETSVRIPKPLKQKLESKGKSLNSVIRQVLQEVNSDEEIRIVNAKGKKIPVKIRIDPLTYAKLMKINDDTNVPLSTIIVSILSQYERGNVLQNRKRNSENRHGKIDKGYPH